MAYQLCKNHTFFKILVTLILIFSGILSKSVLAQTRLLSSPSIDYSYKRYTLHDGLIQMQVTALYQDEKGFLWCGTKGGISRFDGTTFKNYSNDEAKLSGLVVKCGQDENNHLLIFHPNGISRFDGKHFINYLFEDDWFIPDHNSNLLSDNYCLLMKRLPEGNFQFRISSFHDSHIYTRFETETVTRVQGMVAMSDFTNPDLAWIIFDKKAILTDLKTNEIKETLTGQNVNIIFQLQDSLYSIKQNGIHKINHNTSIHIADQQISGSFPKPILSKDGKSVFIKNRDGIYQFKNDSLFIINDKLTYIRDILFDYEGNLWVATEEGLINFFQLDFINYRFSAESPDYIWTIIEDSKNNMWFGSFTNGLWAWDSKLVKDYTEIVQKKHGVSTHFYMGSSKFEENIYFPTINGVLNYDGSRFSKVEGTSGSAYLFTRTMEDGTMLCTGHNGLYEFKPDGTSRHWSEKSLGIKKVTTVNADKFNHYIVGGYNGLTIIAGDEIQTIEHPNLKNILCIEKDHLQNLWIGGINESLFLYDGDSIKSVLSFEDNAIHSIIFIEPGTLLLGCRNGLFIFDVIDYYMNGHTKLIEYNQNNGFIGLECGQNAFFEDSKKDVWIATSDLVTRFNPKRINRLPEIPKIYIESIQVSKDKINWINLDSFEVNSVKHSFASLKIKFASVCFSAIGNINYFFRLSGIQDEWSELQKNDEVLFYNIAPGDYTFYLKANNGNSEVETATLEMKFQILPAFWQKSWFVALSAIILTLLIFLFIRLFFTRKLKKKEKELALERIRTGLQVRALDNKSNHHFIFNILNNIGFSIIKKETDEAYSLFSKLAWYFRLSLKNPDDITTSLAHQLETVNDYLFLQKNRLGGRLDYEIEMNSPELKRNELPRNLFQTIVDNSVTHGIEPKDGGGKVKIQVTNDKDYLRISITDNGIGREKSKNLNLHKKHGLGLNIYKQFFELFNKSNAKKAQLVITDLEDSSNIPLGTKVEIIIPVIYNYIS